MLINYSKTEVAREMTSVRPSVKLVYCIHTAEDIVKLLSPPSSPITVVFLTLCADTQFLQWRRKIHEGRKNLRFSTEIAVYLGNGTR